MTITIELPESAAKDLAASGIDSEQASRYVLVTLLNAASRSKSDARQIRLWWESLSSEAQEYETNRTAASIAAIDSGRTSPLRDAVDRVLSRTSPSKS